MDDVSERERSVPYREKLIPAVVTQKNSTIADYGVILTHGAGGDMNLTQLTLLARQLAQHGFLVLRFTCKGLNLQYRINVYKEVLTFMKNDEFKTLKGCFIGGRSMGARAAIGVSNELQGSNLEQYVLGVICLSYPLHTPKDMTNLRDGPLLQLNKSCLFISGDKDEMCVKSLMENIVCQVPDSNIVWISDADHSLKVKAELESITVEKVGLKILDWSRKNLELIRLFEPSTSNQDTRKQIKPKKDARKIQKRHVELQKEDQSVKKPQMTKNNKKRK